jgi:branched-chain amino acid transport system ATP-binding protein
MAAVTLLEAKGLSRHFGGLKAVENVDFSLPEGKIRALIGPNGAGKTTLVSMLCGRIAVSTGTIKFQGRDISCLPAHKRIQAGMAYTFQITSIFANLSVWDNVALAVQQRLGGKLDRLEAEVRLALDLVGLSGFEAQISGDLAYGHQRLLEIAMGLGQKPKLLILDEPTQGLSDGEVQAFIGLIKTVAQDTTVLLIEHNIDVVMALADRITVMNFGAVIAEGTPAEIHDNQAVQTAYLGG